MKFAWPIFAISILSLASSIGLAQSQPNVIVIMTDDQGIGDFGCMGNPLVQTPNIDAMYERSLSFSNFYVSPVCSPTRASLMTGRYAYRTRVVDTYNGRAMMEPNEVTLAERFQENGYQTGIFGKWHLGDCYPMRPVDQGFSQSVVHRGGGIGQSSDPPSAAGAYTNPILFHNGEPYQESGYCTDVYYDYAMEFIEDCNSQDQPFLVYLTDNCPHSPFKDIPRDWWEKYKDADLTAEKYPSVVGGNPVASNTNKDANARAYAMISNIDENIGRLQEQLERLKIVDNTIVIFLTDNGPNGDRFVKGLRGKKTSVYEGGIKTLCLMQWPVQIKSRRTATQLAGHIDLFPTLLDLCQIPADDDQPKIDGVSLGPIVRGEAIDWESTRKPLFLQVHRGNKPQRYSHFAVRDHRWKLVNHSGFQHRNPSKQPNYELFDIVADPFEKTNLAETNPAVVRDLVAQYDRWFDDVSSTRSNNYDCPTIIVAPDREPELVLTRQDCRRASDAKDWGKSVFWKLKAEQAVKVDLTCTFNNIAKDSSVTLVVQNATYSAKIDPRSNKALFSGISIPQETFELRVYGQNSLGKTIAAYQVYVRASVNR